MILTLEVISPQAAQLGAARSKVFRSDGVIGREQKSGWVLPHGKVSGTHARISYEDGVFYINDSSRNGTFLNSSSNRLTPNRPQALNSGDRLIIGPYEIQVSIAEEEDAGMWRPARSPGSAGADLRSGSAGSFDSDDPFGESGFPAPGGGFPSSPSSKLPEPVEAVPGEEVDPLVLLGMSSQRPPSARPRVADVPGSSSPLDAHFRPPAIIPDVPPAPPSDSSSIPSDYDVLRDSLNPPVPRLGPQGPGQPAPRPCDDVKASPPLAALPGPASFADVPSRPRRAEAASAGSSPGAPSSERSFGDLATVLEGAGLRGVAVTADLARNFGRILRVVVSGVMDVLRARQQIKDEFRVPVTRVRPVDNNPLKLSANVDDALHNLLIKRNAAFLEPVEAFEDAFDDLRDHQIALLEGMRKAFDSMLAQFEPDRLQQAFDRQHKKGALLTIPAKLRYWELYRERYDELVKDPELSFRKLFGEEFARAYEEQLSRLKTVKGAGHEST